MINQLSDLFSKEKTQLRFKDLRFLFFHKIVISVLDLVFEFLQVTVAKFFSSNVLPIKSP